MTYDVELRNNVILEGSKNFDTVEKALEFAEWIKLIGMYILFRSWIKDPILDKWNIDNIIVEIIEV